MALIEVKKIIKDGLIIFLILIALLFAMIATDKEGYLAPVLEIFLLLYASFTGWSMFERERQEGAMEFLLTLPISRIKLYVLKFIPRLIAVFLVLLFFNIIHGYFSEHFYFPFSAFLLIFLTIFILSVSFSLSMKSFMGTFFISIFLVAGLFALINWLDFSLSKSNVSVKIFISYLIYSFIAFTNSSFFLRDIIIFDPSIISA
jgi:ABC-type transport system involved in cytochrome c biogenesis permease component